MAPTVFVSVSYLDELSVAGECAAEYLSLYQKLIKPTHWKVYLAARGVLPYIGNLITKVKALNLLVSLKIRFWFISTDQFIFNLI